MEPFAFATVEELEARWRPLSTSERERAGVLLQDGSQIILGLAGGEPKNLFLAKVVLCSMVKRAMLSPADQAPISNFQQGAGPYQLTQTYVNPTGDLYLTSNEKKLLGISRSAFGFAQPKIGVSDEALS
jgi:hypothetical protein